jgi:hypothetical protein
LIRRLAFVPALLLCLAAGAASATTVTLSTVSSDATSAGDLDADLDFSVSGGTLTLTLTNTGSDFNVNAIYFNATSIVTGLTLTSATRNGSIDVLAAWSPVETNQNADGFGTFEFALTDGVGENNPNIAQQGDTIVFVLSISGSGGYADADFIVANGSGYTAAAKFVNGPPDPECSLDIVSEPCPDGAETEDSAFGAVPEPATTALLAGGLAGLAYLGRRRL